METIRVIPDLEAQGFQDTDYNVTEIKDTLIVGGMSKGTAEGNPVVMLAFKVDNDDYAVKQTTLALFLGAADVLKDKYGDPREAQGNGSGHG